MKLNLLAIFLVLLSLSAWAEFESDAFQVEGGSVEITFIGHASLMFEYRRTVIHVDPVGGKADYSAMPDADIILITHDHRDHFDRRAIEEIRTPNTEVIHTQATQKNITGGTVLKNGESLLLKGITIEAVPAYNTTRARVRFHPKGRDNGYILNLGGKRFYIAGDTEDTPEMRALENIYVAFLPMNQPYTMRPSQVADAAKAFRPEILYPYHFRSSNISTLIELLENEPDIEVRIRRLN